MLSDEARKLFGMQELPPETPQILAIGQEALSSGKVTPGEVVAAQQAASTPKGQKALQELINPKKKKGKEKPEESLSMAPEREPASDFGMDEQRSGIADMEALLSMQAANQPNDQSYVPQGLAALADAWSGSKLSQTIPKMESQSDRNRQMMDSMGELQKRKGDLAKMTMEGKKAELMAQLQDRKADLSEKKMLSAMNNQNTGRDFREKLQEDRQANIGHRQTVSAIKGNKVLKDRLTQYTNLGNNLAIIEQADVTTPQSIDEAQQGIRGNLGIKGTGGVDERDRTRLNSMALEIKRLRQYMTGKPQDVGKDNEILEHIKNLARVERANVKQAFEQQLAVAAGGNDWIYSDPVHGPKYKPSLDALIASSMDQMGDIPQGKKPSDGAAYPSGAPNANWTEEQLEAFNADH